MRSNILEVTRSIKSFSEGVQKAVVDCPNMVAENDFKNAARVALTQYSRGTQSVLVDKFVDSVAAFVFGESGTLTVSGTLQAKNRKYPNTFDDSDIERWIRAPEEEGGKRLTNMDGVSKDGDVSKLVQKIRAITNRGKNPDLNAAVREFLGSAWDESIDISTWANVVLDAWEELALTIPGKLIQRIDQAWKQS